MTNLDDLKGKTFSGFGNYNRNSKRNNDSSNEAEGSDKQVAYATAKSDNTVTVLSISPELKAGGIKQIAYSEKYLHVDDCDGNSTQTDLDKDSISKTLAYFDKLVNGTFSDSLKKAIKLFIAETWEDIGSKTKAKTSTKTKSSDDGDDTFHNYREKENEREDETVFESDDEDPSNYDDNEEPDAQ